MTFNPWDVDEGTCSEGDWPLGGNIDTTKRETKDQKALLSPNNKSDVRFRSDSWMKLSIVYLALKMKPSMSDLKENNKQ